MKRQHLPIALLLLLLLNRVAAQDFRESDFARYTVTDGLSNNVVTGVVQDSTGYIWASTSAGLNRFNGDRFTQFHSNNDSSSLLAEELVGMERLDRYRLATFSSGVHVIDTRTGKTRNLVVPYKDKQYQYKFNTVLGIMGDEADNIYVLTRSGFYHFDKNNELVSRFDYYNDKQVAVEHFFFGRYLHELDKNRLLIISIAGLYVYDKNKKALKKMVESDCPMLAPYMDYPGPGFTPHHFFQLKPGVFLVMNLFSDTIIYLNTIEKRTKISFAPIKWLRSEFHYRSRLLAISDTMVYITSHASGFFKLRLYPETGAVKFYPEKYLPSYLCYALMKDKDNNLWAATNRGLLRQDRGRSQIQLALLPTTITDTLPYLRLGGIYVKGDKVYAGTRDNGGLLIYDKNTLKFTDQVIADNSFNGNFISDIAPVNSSTLLLATGNPLFLFDIATKKERIMVPPQWEPNSWAGDLFNDSKGRIWISAYKIYCYDPATNHFDIIPDYDQLLQQPLAIREDRDGNIWMVGQGLARYNTTLKKYDLALDSFPSIKMHDKRINSIVIDNQNTIWFNSNNNGLIAYCIDKKTFRHFTSKDGLPDNNIAAMIIIGKKLWMATLSGLACMDLETSEIVSFGKEDGLPQMPVMRGSSFFYDSTSQQLYASFSNAIARFNPNDLLQKKSPPRVFIESLSIAGEQKILFPAEKINTSWHDNEITLTIGSLNFSDSYSQQFAYRIVKDNNTPWQQLGSQPLFSISNLSPGTHRIQVKSFSLNNRWPEQIKEISIVVAPPFWQKAWFILLVFGGTMLALYLFVHWRTELARKKEMEKTHIQKLKADDYKNQFELEHISNYFSSSLADKKTEEEVLWDVAANLIGKMNYEDCMIYLWNEDKTKMVQKAAFGPKGKPEYIASQVFDVLPGQGVVGHVIETRQPVLIQDTRKDKRYRVDEEFRLSEVCVPIIHNDELMGIIDSEHHMPGYFSERDIKILTTIATLIANKIKQIESEQTLEVKEKELTSINEQLAEARLSALQAQMNPHFVFNALNSIKRMILERDNEKASRYLSKFASMIRMTLNHSKEIFVTLDENIAYLKAYLEMEQLRFDDSFTYSMETGENIDVSETTIPSMMMQPLVENAIWHGLLPGNGEKKIRIRFNECNNRLTCIIDDNGIGIRQSEKLKEKNKPTHHSVGLENLQKRIKIMNEKYDMGCSLKITDLGETEKNGSGTRVVLQFNLINV